MSLILQQLTLTTSMNLKLILPLAFVLFTCVACDRYLEELKELGKGPKVTKEVYPLPGDRLFPEGIAYNPRKGTFYVGSTINGDVVEVAVQTGNARLFAGGPAQNRLDCRGLKVDAKDRLWICGGEENKIHVLDPAGTPIKSWDTKALFGSGFINDCVADQAYIYFTESRVQKIYRASLNSKVPGEVEEWLTFTNAQIPYGAGFNANGAALTPMANTSSSSFPTRVNCSASTVTPKKRLKFN